MRITMVQIKVALGGVAGEYTEGHGRFIFEILHLSGESKSTVSVYTMRLVLT